MPKEKVVWEADDGTEFDTKEQAEAHEIKLRTKADVPLTIKFAQLKRRQRGLKTLEYSNHTIAGFANMVAFLRTELGDDMVARIVTGRIRPDERRMMEQALNPPKPAKKALSPGMKMMLAENGGQEEEGDD